MDLFSNYFDFLERHWYSRYCGFYLLIIYLLIVAFSFNKLTNFYKVIVSGTFILIVIIWYFSYYSIPKNNSNNIGLLIAIKSNDEKLYNLINWRLIDNLENYINKSHINFNVIKLKWHQIVRFNFNNEEEIEKLLRKTACTVCLYVKCDYGNLNDKKTYLIDLKPIIHNKLLPDKIRMNFIKVINNILFDKLIIADSNELIEFDTSSKQLDILIKYIFSIISLLSLQFETSLLLLEEIKYKLEINNYFNIKMKKIFVNINEQLYTISHIVCTFYYENYRKTKDKKYLKLMSDSLNKMKEYSRRDTKEYLILSSIYYFLDGRQIKLSKKCINTYKSLNKNKEDVVSLINEAFLDAYEGNLTGAYTKYLKGINLRYNMKDVFDVENFIKDVIDEEPNKNHLYFCLGIINHYYKKDYLLAEEDFKKFLFSSSIENNNIKKFILETLKQYNSNKQKENSNSIKIS